MMEAKMQAQEFRPGLEGVVVAETELSRVDGEAGTLVLRGQPVGEVAGRSVAAVAHLLWRGTWPTAEQEQGLARALGEARRTVWPSVVASVGAGGSGAMTAVMTALAGATIDNEDPIAVTATVGVAAAAWAAREAGTLGDVAPDPGLGHAADLLRIAAGGARSAAQAQALQTYLGVVADHGLNASTFTARVVASTGSDLRSAAVAGVAALKGPLHGGAPGPVLDMLDAVERHGDVAAWLRDEIAAGRRIMGMGHRVYRVRDPRAAVLETAAIELGGAGRVELARAIEAEAEHQLALAHPGRRLRANVEFYTAVLLEAVGIPRPAFSAFFAAGRVLGWLAHAAEERKTGRIVRPRARYIGA
jgi:citrate synthase